MRLAILFSGQGNQQPAHFDALRQGAAPELGAALAAAIPETWSSAAPSVAELQANRVAQPLIFACQMHLWRQLQPALPRPVAVAGYSLGEMAACCAAGAFPLEAGVALCAQRAALMDACVAGSAGLLAVLGLRAEAVAELAARCGLMVAIRNGPDHFVLGGHAAGLAEAEQLAQAAGASRVVRLGVGTPSHTPLLAAASAGFAPLLAPASAGFAPLLAPHRSGRLAFPVFSAIDGRAARTAADGMDALARQISTPLDWDACLGAVLEMQPDVVLEIGPGNALARMWGERDSGVPVRASDDFRSAAGIIDWVNARG
ncbi:acyltransferase domain-containing protein [Zoogloea sp. LCSB751]|uniref:acyltransferase domain-containing protein n=1 Tax=Zoogloea sp. LCSB751 TaxID=1965277 RepID=UPI0009A54BE7|nr:acyltransferase domain-containing protein [Zoogloea sp. LCSB751]